jgi:hypothetical protein
MSARPPALHNLAALALTVVAAISGAKAAVPRLSRPAPRHAVAGYGSLPLSFAANRGQVDSRVQYVAQGRGYSLFLTRNEAVLSLRSRPKASRSTGRVKPLHGRARKAAAEQGKRSVLRMKLAGTRPAAAIRAEQPQAGRLNYLVGKDPKKWHRNVPLYGQVRYQGVYPGIDMVYYGNQTQLEYDFKIAPGANPKAIRLQFTGAGKLAVDAAGDLLLHTPAGTLRQQRPVVYQEVNGKRQPVAGRYVLAGKDAVGFQVDAYDTRRALVIDPVLLYSTYLGATTDFDLGTSVAVDGEGNAYIAGTTDDPDFPASPVASTSPSTPGKPELNVFVTKLNANGTALVYSSLIGGSNVELAGGIAVDALGRAFFTGTTFSTDYPTLSAFSEGDISDETVGGDAFVTELDPTGANLVFSTYLGGENEDEGINVALDPLGNAYVTGNTASAESQKVAPFQSDLGGGFDAFITMFQPDGTVVYSSYLGGADDDFGTDVAVSSDGTAYVTGMTFSDPFPTTPGAFSTTYSGGNDFGDAFVTRIAPNGTGMDYSTYLGGSGGDIARGIALDPSGRAYVVGSTDSGNFPITGGTDFGVALIGHGVAAFVTRLTADGSALDYSRLLGGSGPTGNDVDSFADAFDVAVDPANQAYVTGTTTNRDFPNGFAVDTLNNAFVVNPIQAYAGGLDAFVLVLNATSTAAVFSTHLGGSDQDVGYGLALDAQQGIYVTGETTSGDFPTSPGAFLRTKAGGPDTRNVFVTKLGSPAGPPDAAPSNLTATVVTASRIDLAFRDNSTNEEGFEIFRSTDGGPFVSIQQLDSITHSYSDTGLTGNTQYTYRVRATNSVGNSLFSNDASGLTFPTKPAGLHSTALSQTSIRLDWTDASAHPTAFKVERSLDGGGTFQQIGTTPVGVTTFTDSSGLAANQSLFYRVRAFNATGNSVYSDIASARTLPNPPNAPTDLVIVKIVDAAISLAWTDRSNNEDGFKIERKIAAGSFIQIKTVGQNVGNFTDPDLTPGETYAYRVRAFNAGGTSAPSNEVSTTLPFLPAPPTLQATGISTSAIRLDFSDAGPALRGFKIERSLDGGGTFQQIALLESNATTYTDSDGLAPNQTVFYRVRAFNVSGNGPYSPRTRGTTLPIPPNGPTGLVITNIQDAAITLGWTDHSTTEEGFKIERKIGGGVFLEIASLGQNAARYVDPDLRPGETYAYRMRAFNRGGFSEYSNEVSTTLLTLPAAPSGVAATVLGPTSVRVTWVDNSDNESKFRIERSEDGGATFHIFFFVPANQPFFTDTGLTPDTPYVYRVRALNGSGLSAPSTGVAARTAP